MKKELDITFKYIILTITLISLLLSIQGLCIITLIKEDRQDSSAIIEEHDPNITSFDCPFCQGKAVIYPIKDDWYIECDNCGVHTEFFDSKEELISYWSKVYGG